MKQSQKKNYRTYGKTEAIQDLIESVGEDGVSNEAYEQYAELKGFCYPNRKSRKKQ